MHLAFVLLSSPVATAYPDTSGPGSQFFFHGIFDASPGRKAIRDVTHFRVLVNDLQAKISNQQSAQECDATNDAQRAYAGHKKIKL